MPSIDAEATATIAVLLETASNMFGQGNDQVQYIYHCHPLVLRKKTCAASVLLCWRHALRVAENITGIPLLLQLAQLW